MVVVERYPDLKATQAFRDLQVQLEGAENRIAVERMRFVQAAQAFNSARNTFPRNIIAERVRQPVRREGVLQGAGGRRDGAQSPVLTPGRR